MPSHSSLRLYLRLALLIVVVFPALSDAQTGPASGSDYRALSREIFQELIEIKTTESGVGSTPAAEAVARRLRAAGYPDADIHVIGPVPHKKNVVARLHGSGKGKPVLVIGHLDVVEARKEDWSPDLNPFKFIEKDGYFYGRGTQDMKASAAIIATNFIRWKEQGWRPARDLVMALTADEELYGDENGVAWLLKTHRDLVDAEYCLNGDGGGVQMRNGKAYVAEVAAGEKKETILELETQNRGGHGSVPRIDNAIYQLATALKKVESLQFPVQVNDVTRAAFSAMSSLETGQAAADMKAVAANPPDKAAADRLSQDPYYNALLRTTCVATQLEAGHGPSALPQRAKAVLNCRLVPGHAANDLMETLRKTIADEGVKISWQFNEPSDAPASALRQDVFDAVKQVKDRLFPDVVVMPGMETGATDARFVRAAGIPAYGVSGTFLEQGDGRAHGKDERLRVGDFYDGLEFYDQVVRAMIGQ